MGRFGNLQQWTQQASNPAAPAGQQQAAQAARNYERGGGRDFGNLGQYTSQSGYVDQAQSWYTGANREGVTNGWDTAFTRKFIEGQQAAAERGELAEYFTRPDATGVVLYDHKAPGAEGAEKFRFGDVYEDGKKVGNVYDQFDKDTANLMMSDWLLDADVKAEIFSGDDRSQRLNQEIQRVRRTGNVEARQVRKAERFAGEVAETAEEFREGSGDEAIVAGGVAGGAATGAGIGAFAGPLGMAAGAIIGGVAGGIGAHYNRDALTEQAARAYEISERSRERHGAAAGLATGIHQWSGFSMSLLQPMANLTRGITDETMGEVGDGRAEFYRTDKTGESKIPTWLKVADVAATVGDSALQFASPIGVGLYTTQMSGVIGGQVAELAATGGETFDYARGDFDNIFTDEQGDFDASAAAAGLGKIGIDAVQLGMVRGLAQKVDTVRASAGQAATPRILGRLTDPVKRLPERLPRALGGMSAAEREVVKRGGEVVRLGGHRYAVDAKGIATDRRANLSLLAPSEQLSALSTRVVAQRMAARRSGTLSADDFYQAAREMAMGDRKWVNALVNAMGEGYEEGVQAVLEPHSHGHSLDMGDIGQQALYGFAGGLGMGIAFGLRSPNSDDVMLAQAQAGEVLKFGQVVTDKKAWAGLSDSEKRARAAATRVEQEVKRAAFEKVAHEQATDLSAGFVGTAKLKDAFEDAKAADLVRAQPRTDGAFVVSQIEDAATLPSDAVGASGRQTIRNLDAHLRGVQEQVVTLERRVAELDEQIQANPDDADLTAERAKVEAMRARAELTRDLGQRLGEDLMQRVQRMYADDATPATIQAEVDQMNALLRDIFNERFTPGDGTVLSKEEKRALARAVSLQYTRDPQDQSGSYPVLLPQVSAKLTVAGADEMLQISHAILPAIRGDFDGDKIRQLNQLILDDADWVSLRSGEAYTGAGASVNIPATKYEQYNVEVMAEAMAGQNVALGSLAVARLVEIGEAIKGRYRDVVDARIVDDVVERFYEAVKGGDKDARAVLLDGLAGAAGTQIKAYARDNLSNEWMWIDYLVRGTLQSFQEDFAAHRPMVSPEPDTSTVAPVNQTQRVKERRQEHAAVSGNTTGNLLAGSDSFRQAQKLHYSSLVAAVLSAKKPYSREDVTAFAQMYEALGQGLTTTELESVRAKDDITGRVYLRLERLAAEAQKLDPRLSKVEALSVIANVQIGDIDIKPDGEVVPLDTSISLTQFLLKNSLAEDRRTKDVIWEASPELQAKHARLREMTRPYSEKYHVGAERAFVEVVGAQQLFTLLGDESTVFGQQLTVEQFIRHYVSMDTTTRNRMDVDLRSAAPYLGRKRSENMPYRLDELLDGDISAYRAVVDAVLAVGHNRITMDPQAKGRHLHGELAEKSYRTGDDFRSAHRDTRRAVYAYLELDPKSGELDVDLVQRMLERNPDFASRVYDLIPKDAIAGAYSLNPDGTANVSRWVVEMLVERDGDKAEMLYYRNQLLASWNAAGRLGKETEQELEGDSTRKYYHLKRRMHRVMARLSVPGNEFLYSQFIDKLYSAGTVEDFIRWVNTTPGVREREAPLTAWVDDVAEFDKDRANGGWGQDLTGSTQRLAVSALRDSAAALYKDIRSEESAIKTDRPTIAAIRRVVDHDSGKGRELQPGDRETFNRFRKSMQEAGELSLSLGPQAMMYQTVMAALGFYPKAHAKGENPPHLSAAGALDAIHDAFDYVTNYERTMAALTSVNLAAVGGNMGQLAADDLRTMDDHGRPVEWQMPKDPAGRPTLEAVDNMLSLFESPATRPMARAAIFPQVLERDHDGVVRQKSLVGRSLTDLVDGTSHADLFPAWSDSPSTDSALRYVAAVEAHARKYGGHHDLQRMANEVMIARTSAAKQVLSTEQLWEMTVETYVAIAKLLQQTASVAADTSPENVGALEALWKDVRGARKKASLGQRISLLKGDEVAGDFVVSQLRNELKSQLLETIKQLVDARSTADKSEHARFDREIEAAREDMDRQLQRIDDLMDDDLVLRVSTMYGYPADPERDPKATAAAQKNLVEYVSGNWRMLQRSSSSLLTLGKMATQLQDPARAGLLPVLTEAEWNEVSRAVIAVYLDDVLSIGYGDVAPFPDASKPEHHRYYDPSFSYLADRAMDEKSPLVQAAVHVHRLAGRHGERPALKAEIVEHLDQTLFSEKWTGEWTSDIPQNTIAESARLDSAAAPRAIAMAGNLPKRQAVISAATERTFQVPPDELLSSVTLNYLQLGADTFDAVDVVMPTGTVERPFGQLNNRFARSVVARFTDPDGAQQEVDLLDAVPNLGRPWSPDDAAASSGLQAIHLDRVRKAVDEIAGDHSVNPARVQVEIRFFHPDSQPAGPEWMNNLFFEGTSFVLDTDVSASLNATLWFNEGSINPVTQAAALDASKLGQPALKPVKTPTADDRRMAEEDWQTDLAAVLRMKTEMVFATELGQGKLEPEFYNAVYKNMKLRHFVRGKDEDGNVVVWTAEQVIAHQLTGEPLPIVESSLWIPTDDVLRSMLGEQGTQGVARLFRDQLEVDLTNVLAYKGITPTMLQRFTGGFNGQTTTLDNTSIAARSREQMLVVRSQMPQRQRTAYDLKLRELEIREQEIHGERAAWPGLQEKGGFSPTTNLARAMHRAGQMLRAEDISLDWSAMGIRFIGPRMTKDHTLAKMMLHEIEAAVADNGYRTGWIFRNGTEARPPEGLINAASLAANKKAGALRIARGDIVVVEVDSFGGDIEEAERVLQHLSDQGATIVLGTGDGTTYGRPEMAQILRSMNYERIAGSKHAFQPVFETDRYRNARARASTLTEVRGVSRRNRLALFHVQGLSIEENAAWVDFSNPNLKSVNIQMNLVPTNAFAGFNVPVAERGSTAAIDKVKAHLHSLDTPEGRAVLKEQANERYEGKEREAKDLEFDQAFDRMLKRFDDNPGTVLPVAGQRFGTGDMIPLVNGRGQILLYRHGMKAITRDVMQKLFGNPRPSTGDALNVATYTSEPEPQATTHYGTVASWTPRGEHGLQVELEIDLQTLGAKKVLEWNGMKYVLTPRPDSVVLPEHGFFPDWHVDAVVSAYDTVSKQSFEDLMTGHREMFAFTGIDFTSDIARFFGVTGNQGVELLAAFNRQMSGELTVEAADLLLNSPRIGAEMAQRLQPVTAAAGVDNAWIAKLEDGSIEGQIVRAMLVYLSTPGSDIDHILKSGGFNDTESSLDAQSILMPRLFTQVFDNAPFDSPLRVELNRRANAQLYNPKNDGTGYSIDQAFKVTIRNADPRKNLEGYLQFAEAHDSGDNPLKNGMAFDEWSHQQLSQHSASMAYQGINAITSFNSTASRAHALLEGSGVHRFQSSDVADGGVWRFLTNVDHSSMDHSRIETPAEVRRRGFAREAVTQYRQPLRTGEDQGWEKGEPAKYEELKKAIRDQLNLLEGQEFVVDFWVRQMMGAPVGKRKDGSEAGDITGRAAIDAAQDILWAVERHYLPTIAAEVPMLHVSDLRMIYRANEHLADGWAPRSSLERKATTASKWDDWVSVSLGSAFTTENLFDPLYLLSLDGMLHTYQGATDDLTDLPVSMDMLKSEEMWDLETNELLMSLANRVSLDPNEDLLAKEAVMIDTTRSTLDDLIGGRRVAGRLVVQAPPASEIAKRRQRIRQWRKENDVPVPVDTTKKNLYKNGAEFIHHGTTISGLARFLINLRVGTAMINPALYVSMGPEMWIRGTLDRVSNLMSGESTAGVTATAAAKIGASRFTPEQLQKLRRAYRTLGRRSDFKAMIYHDLFYQVPVEHGLNRLEKLSERYAKFGVGFQDPTRGMRTDTMARRYLEAAINSIERTPTLQTLSIDQLAAKIAVDPQFLKNSYPDIHKQALNAVSQFRSIKETVLSQTIRGIVEPMSESSHGARNFFGNVVLRMPLIFSAYGMNVLTTLTGMQGLDQMTAMALHGRKKGPRNVFGRIQRLLSGDEPTSEDDDYFDMSSVIESVDLSRAFIRGGVTHTALFMFGMMASGLGLSGEDEESKRRRLLSEAQGVPYVYDPRLLENDFRNSDAIFLDWLPFGSEWFGVGTDANGNPQSMAELHWVLRQFISPMMGMEKFFQTGDFRQVVWGFQDALGAFPLINTMMWEDTVQTAAEFQEMAKNKENLGGPSNMVQAAGLLTQSVGLYERMLFESSFINMIYVGQDRYDRDPYVLPLRDSDGTIQRDIENVARANNLSVEQYITENRDELTRQIAGGKWQGELYVDPETGEIRQGYQGRDTMSANLHALTENRATMAVVLSLFDGVGNSDWLRYNMAPKVREIEKGSHSQEAAEALIKAAVMGQGGMPNLTPDEAQKMLISRNIQNGVFQDPQVMAREAMMISKGAGVAPMSVLDKDGREHLTEWGKRAVMQGLYKGTVKLGDASLAGVYITAEEREKIQADWTKELVQEGLDMGLDRLAANSRMKRLWFGPLEDPSIQGIGDILWSKDISYADKAQYHQLNTTYVMGPDGKPWATGFTRDGWLGALGLKPLKRAYVSEQSVTGTDGRLNTTDFANNLNTGLRALELIDDSRYIPTDVEIGKAIEQAIKDAAQAEMQPFANKGGGGGGGGWVNFGGGYGGGYGGYGGGGGYSSFGGGSSYFQRMYALPGSTSVYANDVPFINTTNPLIRRGDVRRERVWSERGRLKQWQ